MVHYYLFSAIVDLSAIDNTAATIVFTGISIVFLSLALIYLLFRYLLPLILRSITTRKLKKEGIREIPPGMKEIPGDVTAAIAMAIILNSEEMHDEESRIITITRVSRIYSPWSSKLYSMRNLR
ncbi:MAG: OadG family protein [Bacteroidales bacterium]|jgi:Na+-transporting methylmalonyl-CoA/oxaloacetate decarboxylase gamma subunit|nr:OadG family protein [Bacteroidales bacterium]